MRLRWTAGFVQVAAVKTCDLQRVYPVSAAVLWERAIAVQERNRQLRKARTDVYAQQTRWNLIRRSAPKNSQGFAKPRRQQYSSEDSLISKHVCAYYMAAPSDPVFYRREGAMFTYPPLDATRKEIRLLEFHEDFPIHDYDVFLSCSTMVVSLDDPDRPPYRAISYTWGDSSVRRDILVNGQTFLVPKNAEVALRNLHSKVAGDKPVRLWIDSICINQESNAERSQQVSLMGDIYFNAHEVFIWLGLDDGTAAEVFRSFGLIMAQCRAETDDLTRFMDVVRTQTSSRGFVPRYSNSLESELPQDLNWAALRSLFSCEWFSRLWTVQEAALGRQCTCFRGAYFIDWMDILVSGRWLHYKRYWNLAGSNGEIKSMTAMSPMLALRSPSWGCDRPGHAGWCRVGQCYDGWPIHYLLSNTRFLGISEPRDKLYGIRSLVWKSQRSELIPNYDMEVAEIFARAAKTSIRSSGVTLALVLSVIQGGVDLEWYRKEGWPTWLPCWHLSHVDLVDPIDVLTVSPFDATDGIDVTLGPETLPWWSLQLGGVEMGEVHYVSAIVPKTEEDWWIDDLQQVLQGIWDDALESVSGLLIPVTTAAVGFLMSLCSGLSESRLIAPSDFKLVESPGSDAQSGLILKFDDTKYARLPDNITQAFILYATNRRIFVTSNGYIGLCTRHTQPGDTVCILEGGNMPFVLRSQSDHWLMLGNCYVHSIMQVSRNSLRFSRTRLLLIDVRASSSRLSDARDSWKSAGVRLTFDSDVQSLCRNIFIVLTVDSDVWSYHFDDSAQNLHFYRSRNLVG